MKKFKLILLIIGLLFFMPVQRANATGGFVDDTISVVAQTTYYVAKYTLKASIFIIKKGTKTLVMVSQNLYRGTKDAINSSSKPVVIQKNQNLYYNSTMQNSTIQPQQSGDSLPPVPKFSQY